jgi:D-sedoheptulose 7-phosphate isomerase
MDMIKGYIDELKETLAATDVELLARAIDMVREAWEAGRQVFLFGNGGSAATASHICCDFQKGVSDVTGKPLRAISLSDNVSIMTAWGNDTEYANIFSKQLETLGTEGDVAIAISGSGNSPNVLRAIEVAKHKGMKTIGMTGFAGGKLAPMVDVALIARSDNMQRIEDMHLIWGHIMFVALMGKEPAC